MTEILKNVITKILRDRGQLRAEYIEKITNDESMRMYKQAFTHESMDSMNNYEFLELLGDVTINKSIVWYFSRRFPQIDCKEGVQFLSRLKIAHVSKDSLSEKGDKLGFWPFIDASQDEKESHKRDLLEDVFEAFIGATERLIDNKVMQGAGYSICYNIIASIFDEMEISLRFEDLKDSISRLKELFDLHGERIGKFKYDWSRDDNTGLFTATVIRQFNPTSKKISELYEEIGQLVFSSNKELFKHSDDPKFFNKIGEIAYKSISDTGSFTIVSNKTMYKQRDVIGKGSGYKKNIAMQGAALESLKILAEQGFVEIIPKIYTTFCD